MKIRNTLIAFLLGALITLPLKIYQLLTAVDYSTGFFKTEGALNIILPIVIVLSVVACFTVALLSKQYPQYSPNIKSAPMGIISSVTALCIGWDAAQGLLDQENAVFEGTIGLVYSCLGLICVLAFLFLAVSFFMGNNLIESRPVIMILPVIWMGLRMVLTFFEFTTKANINESIYDLLMMVFMLIFLLSAAKFFSGAAGRSSKLLLASGGAAALFAALATIPRYILILSSNADFSQLSETASQAYQPNFADLMLMAFAVGMMFYASAPVKQRVPQRGMVPVQTRSDNRPAVMGNTQPQYQRQPGRAPYAQGMPGQMMGRPPYMQNQMRRPMMQRPLPGAGPDVYTTRGAGMRVAEDFSTIAQMSEGATKYGGIDTFRDNMLSGRRALEVLESSMTVDRIDDEEGMIMRPTFTVGDIAELNENADSSAELEELNEEVTASLSSLFAQRENAVLAPKEAAIVGASDEAAGEPIPVPEIREADYPPPPPPSRSVSLGSGRHRGRLADRLNEMEERRGRRAQRTPVGRMPYGEYDDRYSMYDDEYYDEPRDEYDEYEEYESYDGYGSYDEDYDNDSEYYDDEYYDEVEYGSSEYYEYDEDDDYDDEYDEYDDEYGDEYDEYDDYGDYDYDDEGYGAPQGGYNYW